jgi:transcriptional regulator with XRE-family HTH domain
MSKPTVVDFERIREHAKANRWSAFQIAVKSGGAVSPATISNIFNGKNTNPGAATLKAICDVIEFPIEDAFIEERAAA